MTTSPAAPPTLHPPTSRTSEFGKWMALIAALLGWLFDGFEMGMFPLVGRPALNELLAPAITADMSAEQIAAIKTAAAAQTNQWFGAIMAVFLIGAATGGVVFGWLGDRIGRVRAMSLSIFTYAIFTGLCGFATEAWHIAVLRFIASLGMGGEWSLGVALVNELWPNRSRAFIAGLIGAAANVGYLLVALISLGLLQQLAGAQGAFEAMGMPHDFTQKLLSNQAWRFMMIVGALPALLIFFIRLFVPESEKWEDEKAKGSTGHWATKDLLGVLIGCGGAALVVVVWSPLVSNILIQVPVTLLGVAIALVGYLHPVMQYLQRAQAAGSMTGAIRSETKKRLLLGAGLTGVALLGTWGALQWAPFWAVQLEPDAAKHAKEYTQIASSCGAILGTILAALLCDWIGRRWAYMLLCVGSLGSAILLYLGNSSFNAQFLACVFLAGGVTAAFYGWFPLYLPELFRTSVRATSQGFAFNFGRIIAAIGTLQTATLMGLFGGSFPKAGAALSFIYVAGMVLIWFCPETKGKPLPE